MPIIPHWLEVQIPVIITVFPSTLNWALSTKAGTLNMPLNVIKHIDAL